MLHPRQFEVNEAWIAFRLNEAPVRTSRDGDFNCIALMDAASCFILGAEFVPAAAAQLTQLEFRRLLKTARAHKQQLPGVLLVPEEELADELIREATRQNVEIVRVPEDDLLLFIGDARQGFAQHFGGSRG